MAQPNSSIDQLATATTEYVSGVVTDAISDHIPLAKKIQANGNRVFVSGGSEARCPIDFAESPNGQWFSNFEPFSTDRTEFLTTANYPWYKMIDDFVISKVDMLMNSDSKTQRVDLVKAGMKNLQRSLLNRFPFRFLKTRPELFQAW